MSLRLLDAMKRFIGSTHAFTEQTGRYITEIAAWHTDYGIGSLTRPLQLRISIKIVETCGRKRATLMELALVSCKRLLSSLSMKAAFTNA